MENVDYWERVEHALELINDSKQWDGTLPFGWQSLEELLQDGINWSKIDPATIIPKMQIREFCKKILNKEVRLAVMKFLYDYAEYYFSDGAGELAWEGETTMTKSYHEEKIRDIIGQFRSELSTQITQIEKLGVYTGDKFSKLQKRITQLEEEIKELKEENRKLTSQIDLYEHPYRHAFYIPNELNEEEFMYIMQYLQNSKIVVPYHDSNNYGLPQLACYRWCGKSKALFGYFADRVSFELDLYKDGHVQWKIFRPAFVNFKDVEKQAKDAISKYKSFTHPRAPLPKGYEIIDEAVRYAERKSNHELDKPAEKNHEVIENR